MDLIRGGMQNLNAKLSGIDDEKLVTRLVEIWNFFWVNVLPYIEGVFLPLQTEAIIISLSRNVKAGHRRGSSPSAVDPPLSDARIDARQLCLTAFRDAIILPRYEKLTLLLSEEMSRTNEKDGDRGENWQWARIQQMLLVLGSSSRTSNGDAPPRGEQATNQLLAFFRRSLPLSTLGHLRDRNSSGFAGIRMGREFLRKPAGVSGAPGDRRGRVDFSPSSRRDLRSPPPNYAESDVPTSQWVRHGRTHVSNSDDDDDSDLGVPLGSATPTLTNARGYGNTPRWHRSSHEPYSSSPETADNHYQRRNPRLDTDAQGLRRGYESDDEEDYGQVVQ